MKNCLGAGSAYKECCENRDREGTSSCTNCRCAPLIIPETRVHDGRIGSMTHYPDSSAYTYSPSGTPLLNVGWLNAWGRFSKGPVNQDLVDRLWAYRDHGTPPCRGFQPCPICNRWRVTFGNAAQVTEIYQGTTRALGSVELRVFGASSGYAAPDLLIHYILRHQYRPPDAFIDAVLTASGPSTREYLERFHAAVGSKLTAQLESPSGAFVTHKDLLRVPSQLLADAECFEPEPTALELEEKAYFTERSQVEEIVHVNVAAGRTVVQAGRAALAAARIRNVSVLVSMSGPQRKQWILRNGVAPQEVVIRDDSNAGWVTEPHAMRFAESFDSEQLKHMTALLLRYFSRNYMLALAGDSSLVEAPRYDAEHRRLEFVAATPRHDDVWNCWWRNVLNQLTCAAPRLLFYQGRALR